ncbi:isoprenyl transferase [Limosilactobacillus equigenerosi]|uniref:Isoprenyl transferase n=1 Tax=Limosilactobacillus equigenerosi DSM 18793 = JCM 14505 TaxID=1423742 RepID=A0A0R1UL46_9LACO|nr:isoprenyl transferase [Limosilactobacillus equigenerosi]KRL94033.1 Di-trans,poly-cis-decaprenylcistransferase [Limosilactobacillus equigenerosi DSM 18793 = JCM 14505]
MENTTMQLDRERIPKHIAIIMDGNGRWAQARHLPRVAGHQQGMQTVKKVTIAASQLGVKVLSLYAFSTENWKRPQTEVKFLMQLPGKFFSTFVPDLIANNVRVQVMGDLTQLPSATQQVVQKAMDDTKACDGMILNFALNYGGRDEIVRATQQIAKQVAAGELTADQIDETTLTNAMMTSELGEYADPELMIRTSGEQRISNFMLWQLAYSEFVFVNQHWPDFDGESLAQAILTFQSRHRRFGGLKNQ